jgi:poly(3-hydroxybutyrate) depolymerase
VFVAGLSAGGAMAAVMGEAYPDLFAGVGVHSGLACGAASDMMSALAAMRGDAAPTHKSVGTGAGMRARTIVFHGASDRTVHPANGDRLVEALTPDAASVETRRSAAGRPYSRTIVSDPQGLALVEYWRIEGAGHAWSGGSPAGSYADAQGPDASAEMVRFFLSLPDDAAR